MKCNKKNKIDYIGNSAYRGRNLFPRPLIVEYLFIYGSLGNVLAVTPVFDEYPSYTERVVCISRSRRTGSHSSHINNMLIRCLQLSAVNLST